MSGAAPSRLGVRMYQVGFGDCFLLSFHYDAPLDDGRDVRHVLFDFGSTRWPALHEGRYTDIADDVAAHAAGTLDAVVVTHRHKDHLGGFGNKQAAAKIASLRPKAVVRPWTENPTAAAGATGPAFVGERSFRYARSLDQAQAFAELVAGSIDQGSVASAETCGTSPRSSSRTRLRSSGSTPSPPPPQTRATTSSPGRRSASTSSFPV